MFAGPQAQTRDQRKQMVERLVQALLTKHGERVLAIGLYGSLAKGIDGPFSDIELFCVLRGGDEDYSHEWVYGDSKAEVNIYGEEAILKSAVEVDDKWSLSQGQLIAAQPLYGDPAFFAYLRELVLSTPPEAFDNVMRAMLVGEFYEWIGKLRNARNSGHTAYIPLLACHFAEFGAQLLGIAHRYCYTTGSKMLEEALQLPNQPAGYAELCALVMKGQLGDSEQVAATVERCWTGMGAWAIANGLTMDEYNRWPL